MDAIYDLSNHEKQIKISMAYAPNKAENHYHEMTVPVGTTIYEALELAGWLNSVRYDTFGDLALWCEQNKNVEIPNMKAWHVGVYSQKQPLSYPLTEDDRIEVYRSLAKDPMSRRKSRVQD